MKARLTLDQGDDDDKYNVPWVDNMAMGIPTMHSLIIGWGF